MTSKKKPIGKVSLKEVRRRHKNENDRIRRANKKFEAMRTPDQRVAIARDVLSQLESKRLHAASGYWLSDNDAGGYNLFSTKEIKNKANTELQKLLRAKKECTGCAIGGLFMCAVERANNLKLSNLAHFDTEEFDVELFESDATSYLESFFERHQLVKIEAAFEMNRGAYSDDVAGAFAPEVTNSNERMKLIMQNIIAHNGTFDPSEQPVAKTVYVTPGFNG